MTWWLSASQAELHAAATCRECGCHDADIDIGLCFDCHSKLPESTRWHMAAGVARKYGLHEQAADYEQRAAGKGQDKPK
jgi:hypothetical protein